VFGAKHDLHSGNYGNWAPNPALELARLLASMKDDSGKVTIAGFYDDVVPLTAEEKRAIAEIPEVEKDQMRGFGFARPEAPGVRLEERHNLPTFNVSGLGSGTVAGQGRTIIPAVATARIDMRLVKAIDPAKQVARLRAHIERQGYHLVGGEQPTDQERATYPKLARLIQFEGYPAGRTSLDQPTAKAVVAAVAAAFQSGTPVRYPTLGGSAPFYIFTDRLGVPAIGMPIANYDNNQHGPNENLQLGAYFDGIQAMRAILTMR
jgi:acetylornithine deacetylase/succinyl-diaminopimelate desuccinylase-like protein